jgi:hypothetical protein
MLITLPPPSSFTWHIGALGLRAVFLGEALPRWHLSPFPTSCLCTSSKSNCSHSFAHQQHHVYTFLCNFASSGSSISRLSCDSLRSSNYSHKWWVPTNVTLNYLIKLFPNFMLEWERPTDNRSWWRKCFHGAGLLSWRCPWALSRSECSCKS